MCFQLFFWPVPRAHYVGHVLPFLVAVELPFGSEPQAGAPVQGRTKGESRKEEEEENEEEEAEDVEEEEDEDGLRPRGAVHRKTDYSFGAQDIGMVLSQSRWPPRFFIFIQRVWDIRVRMGSSTARH